MSEDNKNKPSEKFYFDGLQKLSEIKNPFNVDPLEIMEKINITFFSKTETSVSSVQIGFANFIEWLEEKIKRKISIYEKMKLIDLGSDFIFSESNSPERVNGLFKICALSFLNVQPIN